MIRADDLPDDKRRAAALARMTERFPAVEAHFANVYGLRLPRTVAVFAAFWDSLTDVERRGMDYVGLGPIGITSYFMLQDVNDVRTKFGDFFDYDEVADDDEDSDDEDSAEDDELEEDEVAVLAARRAAMAFTEAENCAFGLVGRSPGWSEQRCQSGFARPSDDCRSAFPTTSSASSSRESEEPSGLDGTRVFGPGKPSFLRICGGFG